MTRIEGDGVLIERSGDGWIASYRFGPMQGSCPHRGFIEAMDWCRRMEATRRGDATAPKVKPGTRCGCRDAKCPGGNGSHGAILIATKKPDRQCVDHAVRMVTVHEPIHVLPTDGRDSRDAVTPGYVPIPAAIPMCEPCARWHEGGAR